MTTIGDRIRQKRRELKLSQKALGDKVGLSQSLIVILEKSNKPSIHLSRLAKALGVDAAWLENGDALRSENQYRVQGQASAPEKEETPQGADFQQKPPYYLGQIMGILEKMDEIGLQKVLALTKEVSEIRKIVKKIEWIENAQMQLCLKAINNLSINGKEIDLDVRGYHISDYVMKRQDAPQ